MLVTEKHQGVSDKFESEFVTTDLKHAIDTCQTDELAPMFRELLPNNQPIVEAGSGAGKWVGWFARNGWKCVGVDMSRTLTENARRQIPDAEFAACDMRDTPFEDGSFGSVVSLGAIEHVIEGPQTSLQEFWRLLRPGGVALITVPRSGMMRKISPKRYFRNWNWARKLGGLEPGDRRTIPALLAKCVQGWDIDLLVHEGSFDFYSYYFTDEQMQKILRDMGWSIEKAFVCYKDAGLGCGFGGLVGKQDGDVFRWNLFGRFLKLLFARSNDGLMLGYILRKPV